VEWADVCIDPNLKDLPYKIELDQWGQIVMSPATVLHVLLQNAIADLLKARSANGKTLLELPVQTAENVKVPDVAWLSPQRYASIKHSAVSPIAPEICIEVLSPSNTLAQMMHKKDLFLAAGALEFWLCDEKGRLTFYDADGVIGHSRLVPGFPSVITLD
jgi:Uma2 family endonuclease